MGRFVAISAMAGMSCCLLAGDGWAQTTDPIFANGFQAGLTTFRPPPSGVPSGTGNQTANTSHHVPLRLRILRSYRSAVAV